ncbi:MAG TPA: RDD family protein [Candidatus Sulfotelmatobacter sp.]|nr:RDD family protein [Candidatus Sulfotelmatobacter sp.]
MTVGALGTSLNRRAEQARDARFARVVALIVDTLFVGLLSSIATAVFGVTQVNTASFAGGGFSTWTSQTEIPAVWAASIWLVYYSVCEAMFSATPGKALNNLRVVSDDGRPLSLLSIAVRNLLRLVDVLPGMYLVGTFLVLITPYSQRLGDLAAHTAVVFREHAIEPGTSRGSSRRARLLFAGVLVALLAFTAGFDYFERPVLVIQGEFNQHMLPNRDIVTYSLGTPARTLGSVRYPITALTPTQRCSGSIGLTWDGLFGWIVTDGQMDCFPS